MRKYIYLLLLLSCSCSLHAEALHYEKIEDKCALTIITPGLAQRKICKLRLQNGLEALLISDPQTHESGAALAVGVGSWDDPADRPGMAHFVEHLLFLGTEKYPEEEGYTRYLDENGGKRNAFTIADRTVYMFSVNNDGFLGALDRFGQFFISPLFNPSGVGRECKAIHQEYCKYQPLDPWRVHYVKKELANANHPFHSFCIGNLDTLAAISQDELKAWYAAHYSANLMHLVVYSSLDLPTLEKEVTALFSNVKNLNTQPSSCPEPLLVQDVEPRLCIVNPIQQVQQLELSWEIPRFYGKDRLIHADKLLSHVLGHEGSCSLLAQLKKENLAEALSVSNFRAGNDQCMLNISIDLTADGVHDYEKVITRCFEALACLRQSGIPRYIYDEVCQIEELRYRFQSREEVFDLVSDYAMRLVDEPLETFPHQTLIPTLHAPDKVQELIASLNADTCHFTLIASPALTNIKPSLKEKWLGVDYTLVPIRSEKVSQWAQASSHAAISIPRPNPFLPSNLEIKGALSEKRCIVPRPALITKEPRGTVYAAVDTQFLVPEVCWIFSFKTPLIVDSDPASHALADLYCHTVNESLKHSSYEALMGGLSYSLKPTKGALELTIKGYSDKAEELLKTVVLAMKNTIPTQQQFTLYSSQFSREYSNVLNANPLKQGSELLSSILYKEFSGLRQKNTALKKIRYEQMRSFCQRLWTESYVEATLYGNIEKAEALSAWEMIKDVLCFAPYPPERHNKIAVASLQGQDYPAYIVLKSDNPANALILATDCGLFSFKKRAAQEILTKGLEEPFFSELRTRQQTAYLVTNWSQELERHLYAFFAIQSSSHDTRDLLARFELFIESSLQHLTDQVIPKERFESIRTAHIEQLHHPCESLISMGEMLHLLAFQYDADFEWLDKRIQAFQELSYEEFVGYATEFLGKSNTRRLAVCVTGETPKKGSFSYKQVTHPDSLRKEISYEPRTTQAVK